MVEISVNYREVENQMRNLRSILSNVTSQTNQEYRQIQSNLRQIDGKSSANYSEALIENNQKVSEACNLINRMASFIANSSRQIEATDIAISRNFRIVRR